MSERRYLLGILVYNGRGVVPRCLDSAARLVGPGVDVTVFDDHSTSPGWSDEVAEMCEARGIGYYNSPRNLGIPRNMSLVMRTAAFSGHDVVGLINSDVVMPANLVSATEAVFAQHDRVASVTPWSNNVSAFSLPMGSDNERLRDGRFVDEMSDALHDVHGGTVIDVPTGVGYCMMLDVEATRRVGTMDPIFGRGYCEEVDWCQRAHLAGLRNVLALGAYVFHEGSGTNRDEGLLAHGQTTVIEHELIIRNRYPDYVARVGAFLDAANLQEHGRSSLARAISRIMEQRGFDLVVSDTPTQTAAERPTVQISGDGLRSWLSHGSVHVEATVQGAWSAERVESLFGRPASLGTYETTPLAGELEAWAQRRSIRVHHRAAYPSRV